MNAHYTQNLSKEDLKGLISSTFVTDTEDKTSKSIYYLELSQGTENTFCSF